MYFLFASWVSARTSLGDLHDSNVSATATLLVTKSLHRASIKGTNMKSERSERGVAPGGAIFNPQESSEEPAEPTGKPKAAPAPGLPVSEEEYQRLKEAAKHAPPAPAEHAQEDRPKKTTGGKRRR